MSMIDFCIFELDVDEHNPHHSINLYQLKSTNNRELHLCVRQ